MKKKPKAISKPDIITLPRTHTWPEDTTATNIEVSNSGTAPIEVHTLDYGVIAVPPGSKAVFVGHKTGENSVSWIPSGTPFKSQ